MRTLAAGILVLLALSAPARADQSARVDLPLERYEELRKTPEPPVSATVVEEARFSGSFAPDGLHLTLEGRAIGKRPEVPLFLEVDGFALHACEGSALLRRSAAGTLSLVPLAERFRATCRVALGPGRERVTFVAGLAVLHVAAAVPNGRIEPGDEGDEGRAVALLRLVSSRQQLPVTATGRYRITLLPDEVAFRYEIALHNPNRDRTVFALPLPNGERVEKTEPVTGDEEGAGWRIEAPPGDSTIALTGRLPGVRFTPPLEASAQMLLVETHPLVKADLAGPSRRVSPAEVGVATQFRGGRGFLLRGREGISWKTSVVEALRTGDVVVQRMDHGIYLARNGSLLGETHLAVANQGAAELSVAVADPLFASVQEMPVLLMPDKDGIRLPLEPGPQKVVVQHRAKVASFAGLLLARIPLLHTAAETGAQRVYLGMPEAWRPLATRFGTAWSLAGPESGFFLWLGLLVLLSERALAALGLAGRARWPLALALAAAGLTANEPFLALAAGLALVGLLRLAARMREGMVTFRRAVVVLAVLGGLLFLVDRSLERYEPGGGGGLGALGASVWRTGGFFAAMRPPVLSAAIMAAPPSARAPMLQMGYQPMQQHQPPARAEYRGLPVRREVPEGERTVVLDQPAGAAPAFLVFLVSDGWFTAFRLALLAAAAALAFRGRGALLAGWRGVLREGGEGFARALRPPA